MKVKEIKRTANIAWSPSAQYPVYLATGTAAQQLDATFSTSAALEIFALDLTSNDFEMPRRGALESEHRFHKLIWSPFGIGSSETTSGLLVGGTDKGSVVIYNADKILNKDKSGCIFSENEKHTGAVQALDFNPFQPNLLASGASDSEIFIWDMNNPGEYFTPGAKSLPPDNISCLAWNRQVQHILASSSPCGRCVVWDLRKNEPIIKVGDQSAMIRCKAVEWHPDTATQMVLASEDDRYPVIQMWDLRFATSPMKVLEGHQRGILSIAWCPQDPDLLMSCAKDNRVLCWNPNEQTPGNEIVYELPTTSHWSFDVRWCPRNPAMICTSSFDGNVSMFSLMGGGTTEQMVEQQKVNDAFDADDPFGSQLQQQQQQQQQQKVATAAPLKKPPKWLRRPCGAKFAFGGKLITFGQHKDTPPNQVHISQVVTEGELVRRSIELEGALVSANFIDYCNDKIQNSTHELERTLWSFLKINFEREPRKHFLTLLGYDTSELSKKVASITGMQGLGDSSGGVDAEELAQKMQLLTSGYTGKGGDRVYSSGATTPSVTEFGESKTPLSDTGSNSEGALAFDAIASGAPPTVDTSAAVPQALPFKIPTDDDTDGLISQALLTGNFEAAVDVCVHKERMADAFLLAIAGGPDLLARIQKRYFEKSKSNVARLMSVVINRDWRDVVENCVLENWKEALAALVTYAKPEEFTSLCDLLGQRLEGEGDKHFSNAMVCYICAGNVEKFVACWSRSMPVEPSPLALQNLVEKVMVLKKAVERERRQIIDSGSNALAEKLSKYSTILAAQGCLETAMGYLMASGDQPSLAVLKDRVFHSQNPSHLTTSSAPPAFPFQRINVLAEPAPQQQTVQQQQQQQQTKYGMQKTRPQQPTGPAFQPTAVPQPSPYQPPQSQPQQPTSFYNPAAYQPAPTQPPSMPNQPNTGLNAGTPPTGQSPYYTPNVRPPTQGSQPWNAPQPHIYQPPSTSVPTQSPVSQAPPTQPLPPQGTTNMPSMYNPASQGMMGSYTGVLTPGAPQGNMPSPTGPPPTGPPPVGPPPSSGAWSNTHVMPKRKQQTSDYTPPAPITMPIFGAPEQQQQQPMQQQQQHQQYQQQQAPPVSHLHPVHDGSNMMPQAGPPGAPPSYPSPRPAVAQEKPPEVIKSPLPAEHVVIQETFDGLVQRCKDMANNPHTKRKLDEVRKRLEGLYDRLREQKLSKPILTGLHEIAQACQSADYPRGLMAHTGLISSGSFSEISSFMPGLKSLMQIATQLRV